MHVHARSGVSTQCFLQQSVKSRPLQGAALQRLPARHRVVLAPLSRPAHPGTIRRPAIAPQAAIGVPEAVAFVAGLSASAIGTVAGMLIADDHVGGLPSPETLEKLIKAAVVGRIAAPALAVVGATIAGALSPVHSNAGLIALVGMLTSEVFYACTLRK